MCVCVCVCIKLTCSFVLSIRVMFYVVVLCINLIGMRRRFKRSSSVSIVNRLPLGTVRLKACSTDPIGVATCSQRIRGYISVMAALQFTYFVD